MVSVYCFILFWLLTLLPINILQACTIWAVSSISSPGGTIIAKNNDAVGDTHDEPRMVINEGALKYFGLFSYRDKQIIDFVAGVNERGLILVSAEPESLPVGKRKNGADVREYILGHCRSVEEALGRKDIFRAARPTIIILGDKDTTTAIEIGPGGTMVQRIIDNSTIAFSNHFTSPSLQSLNKIIDRTSIKRLQRTILLLGTIKEPVHIDHFVAISADTKGHSDENIWRVSSSKGRPGTRTSFIVSLAKEGDPELFMRFANPEDPENPFIINMILDRGFWAESLGKSSP